MTNQEFQDQKFKKGCKPWNKGHAGTAQARAIGQKSADSRKKNNPNSYNTLEQVKTHFKQGNKWGKVAVAFETKVAATLETKYDKIFFPTSVCDRIAIQNGKLIFVEIKMNEKRKLSSTQFQFKEICEKLGIEYLILKGQTIGLIK